MNHYDIAIIGAGVTGAWISYELSKRKCSVVVLEKEHDICMGTSKANSAIVHAGYDPECNTLMAKLNVRGNEIIRESFSRLSIPFRQIGSLVAAFDEEGMEEVRNLYARGVFNGVPDLRILTGEEVRALEKNISEECIGALYAPSAGICSPFELNAAPLEIGAENGVELKTDFKVARVERSKKGFIINDEIEAGYVINCAGVFADEISSLFGDTSFSITPRRGEYCLLDNSVGDLVSHVIFQPPTKKGKGILVSPTVDRNILVGPTAEDIDDKADTETTQAGLDEAFRGAKKTLPIINKGDTITAFSGLRAVCREKNDFIIKESSVKGLYNVAGICSPGLTCAPAIAEYVVKELEDKGIIGEKKEHYKDSRTVIRFNELSTEKKKEVIKNNPLYGRVICRCESVTEGEIVDSIHRPYGARDLDGVKRRTRSGMGRCQGGFCSPRVMEIISRELGIPYTEVTKFGGKSWMVKEKKGEENV